MRLVNKFWPYILIAAVVILFFLPVLKSNIPFSGDLLADTNPYKTQSYLGYSAGGYPNKAQGADVINEIYPWRSFSISELKQGIMPFWNPYNFSGNPQLANFQTAVFYPLNLLYFLLSFNSAWTLIIMSQPFLAAIFMFFFLKKGIGLKNFPSLIGGISFAFSSYMVVWIEYGNIGSTILWLPLVLLFTKRYFKKPGTLDFLGIVAGLTAAILAGYIQGVFYIYVLSFLYYVYLSFITKGSFKKYKKNIIFLISLALPFLITSFQIFPTLQIFSNSTRGAYTLDQIGKTLAPLYIWITAVFPDFFGNQATRNYWIDGTYIERVLYPGVVIVLFAFYSLINKIDIAEKKFFLMVGAVSVLIATNLPLVKYFYLIPIPVISTTVPTREFSIFIFSMIVLGAIGLDHFFSENEKGIKRKFVVLSLGFIILVWLAVLLLIKIIPNLAADLRISEHNMILPSLLVFLTIVAVFIKKYNKNISKALILILVVFDLLYFFNKITPFSPSALIYPQTPIIGYLKQVAGINRYWGYGSAYIQPNFQSVDLTYSPEGNDPLHISRYGELLSSSLNGKLPSVLPRPDANIAPGYGTDELENNFYRKRILDLLGVKYVLNQQFLVDAWQAPDLSTFPINQYTMIKKIYPWQVYENKNALPRYFLASDYVVVKNKQQALPLIYDKNVDLGKTVILENKPDIPIDKAAKISTVNLLSYEPNKVQFKTNSSGNTLLFLSDNNYPDWQVLIDNKQSKILTADYSFRAVAVPKGKHTVEFIYDPIGFRIGLGVGLAGIIALIVMLFYVEKNKKEL